jgi:hypothetical protein
MNRKVLSIILATTGITTWPILLAITNPWWLWFEIPCGLIALLLVGWACDSWTPTPLRLEEDKDIIAEEKRHKLALMQIRHKQIEREVEQEMREIA